MVRIAVATFRASGREFYGWFVLSVADVLSVGTDRHEGCSVAASPQEDNIYHADIVMPVPLDADEDVGVARRRAEVDAVGSAADAGELGRDLLRHELAAEAGLRVLGDVDLEAVGAVHVVDARIRLPATENAP